MKLVLAALPILLLALLAANTWLLVKVVERSNRQVVLELIGLLVLAVTVGWPVGAYLGIRLYCDIDPQAGAQCGFGGIFVAGPLLACIAYFLILSAYSRKPRNRAPVA